MPSVGVLVELAGGPLAGGHVKCWERFAGAAASIDPADLGIDLTVYLLGRREEARHLSPAVRIVTLRPILGNRTLARHLGGVDATDLTPHHPRLATLLPRHDVWHLTHAFGFAATAARLARRHPDRRLTASLHTDVPVLTTAYVDQIIRAAAPLGPHPAHHDAGSPLARLAGHLARRRRDRFLRLCDTVLVATEDERAEIARLVGPDRVALLGRGIDTRRFPTVTNRTAPAAPPHPGRFVVLFVGRVDASKRVMLLGEAVRMLRATGRPVELVVAGSGAQQAALARLLGESVTLLGQIPQEELAATYAGADVLAFPSRSETAGNVVAEAMACGLPVLLPAGARTTAWFARPGTDGIAVAPDTPAGWATELARLIDDPARHRAVAAEAAHTSRTRHRTWQQVLAEDLLPVWTTRTRRPATPSGQLRHTG
ncbi:glycosyltransferase [Plantactinospora sp. WMMC1484]|uniref:glycosyltransferase n=1 Tax=Plantactinospora sp. WMMC1484 TaxID=3404122 RepID=UPI003BF60B2B